MNEIHTKILKIYKIILPLLEEHDIRFTANGGTCIGACREKGFIEWDDDMDLNIVPDDHGKLIAMLNNLPKKLYWKKEDEGIYKVFHKDIFYKGSPVFIDLMQLGYVKRMNKFTYLFSCLLTIHICYNWREVINKKYNKWYLKWPIRLLTFWFPTPLSKKILHFLIKSRKTNFVSQTTTLFWHKRTIHEKGFFVNRIKTEFCDTYIYVPKKYDQYLTQSFGNWMTPIDEGNVHYK